MKVLIAKARTALGSARILLEIGDLPGAANRTYYSVFDAMRASISHVAGIAPKDVTTHHGVFRLFEMHVIAPGLIDSNSARVIYRAQELRWGGDYAVPIELDASEVARTLVSAVAFVDMCARLVGADEEKP